MKCQADKIIFVYFGAVHEARGHFLEPKHNTRVYLPSRWNQFLLTLTEKVWGALWRQAGVFFFCIVFVLFLQRKRACMEYRMCVLKIILTMLQNKSWCNSKSKKKCPSSGCGVVYALQAEIKKVVCVGEQTAHQAWLLFNSSTCCRQLAALGLITGWGEIRCNMCGECTFSLKCTCWHFLWFVYRAGDGFLEFAHSPVML